MDPSLRNWGLASGYLDLTTGELDTVRLTLVQPTDFKDKQVRKNSQDLSRAEQLATHVHAAAAAARVVFVECPVGSQSARAMASYGICVGILGSLRASGIQLIEVTPAAVKVALTGNKEATKSQMIEQAVLRHPAANWPYKRGNLVASSSEHLADAVASIYAGVNTPAFRNLQRLFAAIQ